MRKGGVLSWILLIFVFLIGGVFMLISAAGDITGADKLMNSVTVEEKVVYTANSGIASQLAHMVLYTDHSGVQGHEIVRKYLYCFQQGSGCVSPPSKSDVKSMIQKKINNYFSSRNVEKKPYLVILERDASEVLVINKGVNTGVADSGTYPKFKNQGSKVQYPINVPDGSNASVTFYFPLGNSEIVGVAE